MKKWLIKLSREEGNRRKGKDDVYLVVCANPKRGTSEAYILTPPIFNMPVKVN